MDLKIFGPLLATVVVAVLGWWIGHWLSSRRDLANDRRKLRVTYLLEAYRKLEVSSNNLDVESRQLESAIADIQLLGTPKQVTLARSFAETFARNREASLDELLFDLRQSLRIELQLEPVDDRLVHLRMKDNLQ